MPRERTLRTDRMPEKARNSQIPDKSRGRITFGDVIAEKLQGSTVSTFTVKRALKFARDPALPSEDRVKIINALSTPSNDALPLDWSRALLGNIAKNKDNDPSVRDAAKRTLFYRTRK